MEDILAMLKEREPTEVATVLLASFLVVMLVNVYIKKSLKKEEAIKPKQACRLQFMVTMPQGQVPNRPMEATAPDGQVMQFQAPNVKTGEEFPVVYDVGGAGGAPPVDIAVASSVMKVQNEYDMHMASPTDLLVLKDYDTIIIADDSGSMRTVDTGCKLSRWEELKETLKLLVSIATCFDDDGVDIYFLNRPKLKNVSSITDAGFVDAFRNMPSGSTPLTEKLNEIVRDREEAVKNELTDKPVLLMIFTDGVPNGGADNFGKALENVLTKKTTNLTFRCQILACTGKDADIAWLKPLDEKLKELDVSDDYLSEKEEVEKKTKRPFTRGDWCMKAMLGAVLEKYDSMDEDGIFQPKFLSRVLRNWLVTMACLVGMVYAVTTVQKSQKK